MNKEQIQFRLSSYVKIIKQEQGEAEKIRARVAWWNWAMDNKN